MKKLSLALIVLFILGVYGCPKDSSQITESKVRSLLAEKRELSSQIMDINSQIQKLVAEKKAEDNDEKALNDFFHPKAKVPAAVATSSGIKK